MCTIRETHLNPLSSFNIPDMHDQSYDNHECEEDVERKASRIV